MPWPDRPCGRRGAGRAPPSAGRSRPSRRRWPAMAAPSSSSTAAPRRSPPRRSAASAPATGSSRPLVGDPNGDGLGIVELLPPGARMPPGARTRGNQPLDVVPGGAGDPDVIHGRRPVRGPGTVRQPALLRGRGRPHRHRGRRRDPAGPRRTRPMGATARRDPGRPRPGGPAAPARRRRRGRHRRPTARRRRGTDGRRAADALGGGRPPDPDRRRPARADARPGRPPEARPPRRPAPSAAAPARPRPPHARAADPVDRLLALIRDEMNRTDQTPPRRDRARPLVAGRRGGPRRRRGAAGRPRRMGRLQPAVDRRPAVRGRVLRPDRRPLRRPRPARRGPRPGLPRQLPERGQHLGPAGDHRRPPAPQPRSTPRLLARARGRRAIGWACASGSAAASRRRELGRGVLGDVLDEREHHAYLGGISRAIDELAEVDCVWYIRGKLALPLRGRVDRDARRAAAPQARQDRAGRADRPLPRRSRRADRAGPLQARPVAAPARAPWSDGSWHILKSVHLRRFLAAETPDLADLEPLLGLDPAIERSSEQLPHVRRLTRRPGARARRQRSRGGTL